MMIKNILVAFVLLISSHVFAQSLTYSQVEVHLNSKAQIQQLASLGFDIDHYQSTAEDKIRFFVTPDEKEKLAFHNFNFEVTIPDYAAHYKAMQTADRLLHPNPSKPENVAQGFDLGSMGGFYTFSEVEAKLDEMKTDYPNLITAKTSIGTSVEGRPIWMVKISDNPDIDEPEPAAHFDALHHAREPLSMASTINYMFWLLENYATNPQVQFLVDNRELYFVPVVNPDGYVYNQTTDPNGGGFWRKNRSLPVGGCEGVDLNRNYGFGYATNNSCSSPDPCSGIYRGPEAFSEPETQAIRDHLANVQPNTAFSTHSTAGTYLMPYGYDTSPPAFDIYSEWASTFLSENDYTYGVTFQMLGYTSCGTTRDYLHSEGIYGWTPEIGGQGFWPPQSTIFDLVAENVRPFFYQSFIAGAYLDVQSHKILGPVLPGETFELVVEIKNVGVEQTATDVGVIAQASSNEIVSPTAAVYNNVPARTKTDNAAQPFQFSIDPGFSDGFFTITVTTTQEGTPNETLTIPVFVGQKEVLFYDDAESGAGNWTAGGSDILWSINEDDSYSGSQSFGDSNDGNSRNDTSNSFSLNETFNLEGVSGPQVQFVAKHSLEEDDVVHFEISPDNGANWTRLRTYTNNELWTIQSFNLEDYIGSSQVKFRFTMTTDDSRPSDGFYFDDFEVANYVDGILTVSEHNFDATFAVAPNPFQNSISITFSEALHISEVYVYDLLGKKVEVSVQHTPSEIVITDVTTLQAGMYVLVLKDNTTGRQWVKRVVKK